MLEQYSKEAVLHEIRTDKRVGTVDTLETNIEFMERDLAGINKTIYIQLKTT